MSPKLEGGAPEEIALAINRVIADAHGLEQEKVFSRHASCLAMPVWEREMRQRVNCRD